MLDSVNNISVDDPIFHCVELFKIDNGFTEAELCEYFGVNGRYFDCFREKKIQFSRCDRENFIKKLKLSPEEIINLHKNHPLPSNADLFHLVRSLKAVSYLKNSKIALESGNSTSTIQKILSNDHAAKITAKTTGGILDAFNTPAKDAHIYSDYARFKPSVGRLSAFLSFMMNKHGASPEHIENETFIRPRITKDYLACSLPTVEPYALIAYARFFKYEPREVCKFTPGHLVA